MATIATKDGTQIHYKDWGTGQPVVFSHGWPLSGDAFEDQMFFLSSRGYRCIAHDRRGLAGAGLGLVALVAGRRDCAHLRISCACGRAWTFSRQ